ncbi:uncharacterized protein LOC118278375 [Spodoptera frugiperda]|uniref:Uncharacterized protein LOC118278375 n=1 Tax=Spodoptera frugiperda TaxID=7108 RepID=A0A9R0E5N9_SPOFR|nr:uncharacterized protein LOC118278375 [Spodoptera frugiperda]
MDKSTSKASKIAAWILMTINAIFMVICLLFVALGLWILSSPSTLFKVIEVTGNSTVKALTQDTLTLPVGIAITSVAVFLFFISFMGFRGAMTRSPFLLFMYSALVLLLLLLECALLYYFSSNLVEKGLHKDDGLWTHAMRLAFRCCEHNTSIPETRKPPWSCCGPDTYPDNCTTSLMYQKDCHASIVSWLDRYQLPMYTSLAVFHVVMATCAIIRRSSSTSQPFS